MTHTGSDGGVVAELVNPLVQRGAEFLGLDDDVGSDQVPAYPPHVR